MTDTKKPLEGRRICLSAPARWVYGDVIDPFVARANDAWGAWVTLDPQIYERSNGQLAGSDNFREGALATALNSPDHIVWGVRGGYGSMRLLKQLATRKHPPEAPVFVGYSDLTAIHNHLLGTKVIPVHAAMPFDLKKPEKMANLDAAAALIGTLLDTGRPPARRYDLAAVRAGEAKAPLIPANLSVLVSLIGTPYEPRWESAILALEDVDEYLYAIDRMMWRLSESRLAPRIKAIVLGEFAGTLDNDVPWGKTVGEIAALNFPNIPIADGLPFGHGLVNLPFVVGEPAMLSVGAKATLTLGPDLGLVGA